MLHIGIVGKDFYHLYYQILKTDQRFQFVGVFDPSFQFDIPASFSINESFLSFEDLLANCDALIFATTEKIYLPLIELAIKKSKALFLHGAYNLTVHELSMLQKLNDEAQTVLQIQHPFIFHRAFTDNLKQTQLPRLIESKQCGIPEINLLPHIQDHILAIFCMSNANIKKITANPMATFSEIPDVLKVRIDFFNGCIADIHVNTLDKIHVNRIKSYNLNSYSVIDFEQNTLCIYNNNQEFKPSYPTITTTQPYILTTQLANFYSNILHQQQPLINIDKQIHTQIAVAKIKEKLRLCINL